MTEKQPDIDILQFKFNDQIQNSMLRELEVMMRERERKGMHLIEEYRLTAFLDDL